MRVLVAVLALLLLGACAPAPRELTAREVLDRSADALDKATTAHFALDQQNGSVQLASGVSIVNAEGDVLRPDRMRMSFTLRLGGFSAESKLIAVGDELFITNPLSGAWQKVPSTTGAPRVLDKEHGMSNMLRKVADAQRVGNESLDGAQTQHLKGRVPAATFADMTGTTPTSDAVAGDVWVGSDDFLPRQVRLEGLIGAGDTAATVRILKFSKFNEPVTIERPS